MSGLFRIGEAYVAKFSILGRRRFDTDIHVLARLSITRGRKSWVSLYRKAPALLHLWQEGRAPYVSLHGAYGCPVNIICKPCVDLMLILQGPCKEETQEISK
jgi:hypothetical protein